MTRRTTGFRVFTVLLVLAAGVASLALIWRWRRAAPAAYTSVPEEHPLFEEAPGGMVVRKNLDQVELRAFARPHALPLLEEPGEHADDIAKRLVYRCSTNSMGFRGPEISRERQPGVARVVFVGDSIVFGHGVGDSETLTHALGELLPDPERFELINAGVPAHRSWDAVIDLQRRVLPLQPDAVFLAVGINDVVHVVENAWRAGSRSFTLTPREMEATLALYRRQVTAFVDLCQASGVAVELLVPPTSTFYPFPDYQRLVTEIHGVGEKRGVPVLDLQQLIRQAEVRDGLALVETGDQQQLVRYRGGLPQVLLSATVRPDRPYRVAAEIYDYLEEQPVAQHNMLDGCHPNARGHRLLAEALVPELLALLESTAAQPDASPNPLH
jgi:lysophospholipase L1-like esterase